MDEELKLKGVIEKLTKNIDGLETELTFINAAMAKLKREHNDSIERINRSKEVLLSKVEAYFETAINEISKTYDKSLETLEQSRVKAEETLKSSKNDLKSCWSFQETDKDTGLISKRKAYELFLESVNTRYGRRNVLFDVKRFVEGHRDLLPTMIGSVERIRIPLNEYIMKTKLMKSFDVTDQEINAFAAAGDSMWVCFGAKNIIERYDIKGNVKEKKVLDASVNDMVLDGSGNMLFTSPDKTCIRKTTLKQHQDNECVTSNKFIESEYFLHGLYLSGDIIITCGTDKPNYSTMRPSLSELLFYDHSGSLLKNISLPFTGKVYRLTQNFNGDYVCSYPYEGVVSIVNKNGGLVKISNGETSDVLQERFKPSGVACDSKGNVFVSDWQQKCILIFDKHGHFLRKIGGDFAAPNAVCVDNKDRIWIGDRGKISVWALSKDF